MSVNSANPSTIFGGTWEQIKDKFLLSAGDTYSNGTTGGEASHTLTTAELPAHAHGLNNHTHSIPALSGSTNEAGSHSHTVSSGSVLTMYSTNNGNVGWSSGSTMQGMSLLTLPAGAHSHTVTTTASTTGGNSGKTTNTGSGNAHNNMPPYLAVYVWQRTA